METREIIVSTAAKLFKMKGYSATGLNEILAVSGAPKGSLYHYFPQGKLQLAIEAVRYAGEAINRDVASRLAGEADPVRACRSVVRDILVHFSEGSDFMDISLSIISLEAPMEAESLRLACQSVLDRRGELFAQKFFEAGWSEAESNRIASVMLVLIEGAIVITRTRGESSALHVVGEILPGLLEREGHKRKEEH